MRADDTLCQRHSDSCAFDVLVEAFKQIENTLMKRGIYADAIVLN